VADHGADTVAELELALDPSAAPRLPRLPAFARRPGRVRATAMHVLWYDTPEGALAADGLSLCERRVGRETMWRLERLCGTVEAPWPPGTPAPVVAEASLPAGLGHALPAPLLPVAAFAGRLRPLALADATASPQVTLLDGTVRAVVGERPVCRVLLAGPPEALETLALALGADLPLRAPEASLAAEAYEIAGRVMTPRALGAPELPTGVTVAEAFARVAAHLAAVLLHWAPLAAAGATPEPVHQMRVALRRLRSALSLFRASVGGPVLDSVNDDLRALSAVLGPARDWDVFGAGIGRAVAACFPDDRAVARLLAAAERRRQAGYAALRAHLEGQGFRLLGLRLACLVTLRPWERPAEASADDEAATKQAALRATPVAAFAARALARRLERVRDPGEDFSALPIAALHAIRIQCKRLRYAAEFFAPLFPRKETRRFIRRVGALQERLGHLNDSAAAEGLMAQLGGGGGAERAMAVGIVRGFVAAGLRGARAKSERSWRKFCRLEPFWE
jgi:triphosphatase